MDYDNPRPSSQPVGSTDQVVLKDNLITLDYIVNDDTGTPLTNRKGNEVPSVLTLERQVNEAIASMGFEIVGDFGDATKVELTKGSQVYSSKLVAGYESALWRTTEPLPYTPTGSDPTSGAELGKWALVAQGDLSSVARALGVKDSEVAYSTDTVTDVSQVVAIFNSASGVVYMLDGKADAGELIISLSGNVLTTTNQTLYLRVMPSVDTKKVTPDVYLPLGNKLYDTLSGSPSFSRATTRGNINKSGFVETTAIDEPCITANGASLYGPITNLITWSEAVENAAWNSSGAITRTANYGTAPDGTTTSTRLQRTGDARIEQYAATTASSDVTGSIWIKGVAGETCSFKVASVVMGITLTGGWQLINISDQASTTSTPLKLSFGFAGTTAMDVEVWGGAMTESSYLLPYIKTEGAAETAGADMLTTPIMNNMPAPGLPFSIAATCALPESVGAWHTVIRGETQSASGFMIQRTTTNDVRFAMGNGTAIVGVSRSGIDSNEHTYRLNFDGVTIVAYIDGARVGAYVITNATYDVTKDIGIGVNTAGSHPLNSEIRDVEITHKSLSEDEVSLQDGPK